VPVLSRSDQLVYERAVLLATWHALRQHGSTVRLPEDLPILVERVYGGRPADTMEAELRVAFEEALAAMVQRDARDAQQASQRHILPPDHEDLLTGQNLGLEEDDPRINDAFQALTRADPPGVSLVCVFNGLNGFSLDPDSDGLALGPNPFAPDPDEALGLALNTVTIQRPQALLAHLLIPLDNHYPPAWKKQALLKYSRLACFVNGNCEIQTPAGTYRLTLTRALGLRLTAVIDPQHLIHPWEDQ
jgi:hypothetical protein